MSGIAGVRAPARRSLVERGEVPGGDCHPRPGDEGVRNEPQGKCGPRAAGSAGPYGTEDGQAMTEPRINRSWKAAPGYRDEFALVDRLHGILGHVVISEQLSVEEAELIQAAVTDEARSRHAAEARAEEYHQWRAETDARIAAESRARDAEWAERVDRRHRWIQALAQAGELMLPPDQDRSSGERSDPEAEAC